MGITGFGPPLMREWRMGPRDTPDDAFVETCLRMWDRGLDTKDIADITFQWEHVIERVVRLGRERRRAKEKKDEERF
jgi:hypothetical protein